MQSRTATLDVAGRAVSARFDLPRGTPLCAYAFAHGAGAGMQHAFMAAVTHALVARQIAVLRYQFPYMEAGSKRPDPPALCQATVRAAIDWLGKQSAPLPLFAGGKSMGGRMTSQAAAEAPLPGIRGLAFFGFPLHPARKPGIQRAAHLPAVGLPMLFLQGTRDDLADLALLGGVLGNLPEHTLHVVDDADHAFHVRRRSGRDDAAVVAELTDSFALWIDRHI